MKKVIIVLLAIVFCLAGVIYWGTGSADYTPYLAQPYYLKTKDRLDSLRLAMHNDTGLLQAGFGKSAITPVVNADADNVSKGEFKNIPLAGYGDRQGRPAQGTHDSLWVKTIALNVGSKRLFLIGVDMLIVPPELADSVATVMHEIRNIKREQLVFSATHTHSSVGGWAKGYVGKEFAGAENKHVQAWLVQQFVRSILQAENDLKPARTGNGRFAAADFTKNRVIGDRGRVNDEFTFMVIEQNGGRKAIMGSFSAHATTIGASNMNFSAEYPGYWERKLENSQADMAVFFAGPVGSHSPRGQGKSFERARYIGEALADSVIKYSAATKLNDAVTLKSITLKIDLPDYHIRISPQIHLSTYLSASLLPAWDKVHLQAIRLGNFVMLTTPSDFSGELAIDLQNMLYRAGYNAMVTSFNGAYVGYIIPGRYFYMDEYESKTMGWYGPTMGDYVVDMLQQMAKSVI